jgi:hypothetical protein
MKNWQEGIVNTACEHVKLYYGEWGDICDTAALVAPNRDDCFTVQFLLKAESGDLNASDILEAIRAELNFFLVEKGENDPWKYVKYHCTTAAEMYSKVHWVYYPHGVFDVRRPSVILFKNLR